MSFVIALLLDLYWLVTLIGEGRAGWAAAFAFLPGVALGMALVKTYRRGEVVQLKRELAGYREWDEDR